MATRSVLSSGLDGKDVVIVATREELATPSKVSLPEPDPTPGLILADGSINWACPCLGGMSTGPCGSQFREAFSCFHYSDADPKGSDCYEKFSVMQECMSHYPDLYGKDDDDEMAAAMDAAGSDKHEPADHELHKEAARTDEHGPREEAARAPDHEKHEQQESRVEHEQHEPRAEQEPQEARAAALVGPAGDSR